jgi:hypothetical protein
MISLKRILATRKLQRMVEANRRSFATQDYAKRRAAALKATRARAEA